LISDKSGIIRSKKTINTQFKFVNSNAQLSARQNSKPTKAPTGIINRTKLNNTGPTINQELTTSHKQKKKNNYQYISLNAKATRKQTIYEHNKQNP